jgi:acetyl esterase/lipase
LGILPHKVVVTGDSAGGAILLETMLEIYAPELLSGAGSSTASDRTRNSKELPAAMLLVSPVMCAETKSPSWKKNAKHDMVGPKLFKKVFKEYFGTTDPSATDVRLIAMTQMQHGFDQFLPKNAMIVVGSKEVMRDDITEMALRVVKNSNVTGHLLSEDYAHDWYVIRDTVKNKDALKRSDRIFADFVANALQEAKRDNEGNATGKLIDTGSSISEQETPESTVKFTRNGLTMSFTKGTVLELMGNFEGDNVAVDGYGRTLDSIADMAGSSQTRLLAA